MFGHVQGHLKVNLLCRLFNALYCLCIISYHTQLKLMFCLLSEIDTVLAYKSRRE